MAPEVREFSHHRPEEGTQQEVLVAMQPADMWQDCYQTGLYPICRSDTELASVRGGSKEFPGVSWHCTDVGKGRERDGWKLSESSDRRCPRQMRRGRTWGRSGRRSGRRGSPGCCGSTALRPSAWAVEVAPTQLRSVCFCRLSCFSHDHPHRPPHPWFLYLDFTLKFPTSVHVFFQYLHLKDLV